eukprot:15076883-Alexandrium_andersonii.AAC.1
MRVPPAAGLDRKKLEAMVRARSAAISSSGSTPLRRSGTPTSSSPTIPPGERLLRHALPLPLR